MTALQGWALWDSLPSTQVAAESIVETYQESDLQPPPLLVAAREQTAGRGRNQLFWHSPPGGYYASLILPLRGGELTALPLKAGMVLARFLESATGVSLRLKWPNDLYAGEGKVGGILVKVRGSVAVAGFGINLRTERTSLEEAGLNEAATLRDIAAVPFSVEEFHRSVPGDLCPDLLEIPHRPFSPGEWDSLSFLDPGTPLRWLESDRPHEGLYRGVDGDGFMVVEEGGSRRTVLSATGVRRQP